MQKVVDKDINKTSYKLANLPESAQLEYLALKCEYECDKIDDEQEGQEDDSDDDDVSDDSDESDEYSSDDETYPAVRWRERSQKKKALETLRVKATLLMRKEDEEEELHHEAVNRLKTKEREEREKEENEEAKSLGEALQKGAKGARKAIKNISRVQGRKLAALSDKVWGRVSFALLL